MKVTTFTVIPLLSAVWLLTSFGRSGIDKKAWASDEVEVAPGLFLEIEDRSASADDGRKLSWRDLHGRNAPTAKFWEVVELRMKWQGSNVHWKGNSRPLNLRAFEGKLYLITFDRVSRDNDECFFRYFAQQDGELREIPPSAFPRAVAGQNLDFYHRYSMGMTGRLDAVQIAREQDTSDVYFRTSLTADIWNHLATGQQYWETHKWSSEVSKSLLDDFIRTNKPIKLTSIVREPPASKSEGKVGTTNQSPKVP